MGWPNPGAMSLIQKVHKRKEPKGNMIMLKQEFESLIEKVVSNEDYEKIESVYTAFDRFINHESISTFYQNFGMKGIDALNNALKVAKAERDVAMEVQVYADGLAAKARLTALQYGISL